MRASRSAMQPRTPYPVTASIRRTPAATDDSEMIFISPISPVFEQCVPPQSSSEKSPARTMRTVFPYFSPNSAIAPAAFADSMSVSTEVTSSASRMCSFTSFSICAISSAVRAWKCEKSKRSRCASTYEPACSTWSPRIRRSAD